MIGQLSFVLRSHWSIPPRRLTLSLLGVSRTSCSLHQIMLWFIHLHQMTLTTNYLKPLQLFQIKISFHLSINHKSTTAICWMSSKCSLQSQNRRPLLSKWNQNPSQRKAFYRSVLLPFIYSFTWQLFFTLHNALMYNTKNKNETIRGGGRFLALFKKSVSQKQKHLKRFCI